MPWQPEQPEDAMLLQQSQEVRREFKPLRLILCIAIVLGAGLILRRLDPLQQLKAVHSPTFQDRMNAATFWRAKIDWAVNHATEKNMILLQSVTTVIALGWYVYYYFLWSAESLTCIFQAPSANMEDPL
jgi:hypothetical protein